MRKYFIFLFSFCLVFIFFTKTNPQPVCASNDGDPNTCLYQVPADSNNPCPKGALCFAEKRIDSCNLLAPAGDQVCPDGYSYAQTLGCFPSAKNEGTCCSPCELGEGATNCTTFAGATDPSQCCQTGLICQISSAQQGQGASQCVRPNQNQCTGTTGDPCLVSATSGSTCCASPYSCIVSGRGQHGFCGRLNPTPIPTSACIKANAQGCWGNLSDPQGNCCEGSICTDPTNQSGYSVYNGTCTPSTADTPTAAPPPIPCTKDSNANCVSVDTGLGNISTNLPTAIGNIFGIFLSFSGGILLIIIVFSGYRIMTSQGDPEKIKGAKEMLTSAIVGFLFIVFSITILRVIGVDILHIPGFSF